MSTRGPRRKQMHRWCRPPHDKDQRTPGFRSGTHPRPQRWRLLSGNNLVKKAFNKKKTQIRIEIRGVPFCQKTVAPLIKITFDVLALKYGILILQK